MSGALTMNSICTFTSVGGSEPRHPATTQVAENDPPGSRTGESPGHRAVTRQRAGSTSCPFQLNVDGRFFRIRYGTVPL